MTDIFLKTAGLKLAPGSTPLADELEKVAEELTLDPSPQRRDYLEMDLQLWFEDQTIPARRPRRGK